MKNNLFKIVFIAGIVLSLLPRTAAAQPKQKGLYFHGGGMDRVEPTNPTPTTVTIADGGSNTWTESPVHLGDITLQGSHTVTLVLSNVVGAPDVTVEIGYYSGATFNSIGTKYKKDLGAGTVNFKINGMMPYPIIKPVYAIYFLVIGFDEYGFAAKIGKQFISGIYLAIISRLALDFRQGHIPVAHLFKIFKLRPPNL